MVQESLPVKASDVASPVKGAVLASRSREDRRPSSQAEKKRPRATPPPPDADTTTPRTNDEGDEHEIDILA